MPDKSSKQPRWGGRKLDAAKLKALADIVTAFVDAQEITCAEAVAQDDKVIENAYEFIESLCEVVGYFELQDN